MSFSDSLLDMTLSQRAASWRFDVVDQTLVPRRELEVDRTGPPTLSVDVGRAQKRTLTGMRLLPNVVDELDVIGERLKLTMILSDGSEWPWGVFLFTDVSRHVISNMLDQQLVEGALSLVDQTLIVDQKLDRSISYLPGTQITLIMAELISDLPVTCTIDQSGQVVTAEQEAISWSAGTSRLQIINELATMASYHDLYFDNTGIGRLGLMPNPETTLSSQVLEYPIGQRTFRDSTTRSTNVLELPNRFIVVNNGATQTAVSGRYDVPSDAPHSIANRGFAVTFVQDMQGIDTNTEATQAARALAREWKFSFETVEFAGPPDPRHDHYNTVEFEGTRFLELGWSLSLREGAEMRHTLRRVYEHELEDT